MTKHAKLSASGSHRWLFCPGSVNAERDIKDSGPSFAQEGTCAHELAEICLNDRGAQPIDFLGETLNDAPTVKVDKDMVHYVNQYLDYCTSFETFSSESFPEERVDFSPWVPGGFGTSDFILIDGGVCRVIDLKYGMGKKVYAADNPQAQLYALGVLNDFGPLFDIDTFIVTIYQPRINHVDEWEISTKDLLAFGDWVKGRAALCLKPDAERVPGESQCTFCKAKATCPALKKHIDNVIGSEFEDLDANKVESVDIGNVLRNKSLIEGWLTAVESHAMSKLEGGEPVDGFKLVAGRSTRKWANNDVESVLVSELGDDLYTKKMISPTQAEKLIGKKAFNEKYSDLVVKPEGKPTIAPDSDKRPALQKTSDLFDDIS